MSVIYVKEQGTLVQKRSERVLITKDRKVLLETPMDRVESIAVIGNVQVTTQALCAFMQAGIDINYFTFSGKFVGAACAESSKNIFLRLAQYDLYRNEAKRLEIAKRIVRNKIQNQVEVIKKYRWESGETEWKEVLKGMEALAEKTGMAETSSELMGIEGKASNLYFRMYGKMFKCKFTFDGRNRRPPRDPINVIISLGYTFLTKEVSAALEAESFEMYMGFLHGIRYGRKSLPLDIVEEFRQPIIDRMALKLFNKSMLQEYDFTFEEDAVILNENGFQKFCREFERWMTDSSISERNLSYRAVIQKQAKLLKQAVQQKGEYEPFCIK